MFRPEKINRVILKISGEHLAGSGKFGYCPETITSLVEDIIQVKKLGINVGIVLGGGNLFRGINAEKNGIKQVVADNVGMLATVQNALVVSDYLEKANHMCDVFSAIQIDRLARLYNPQKAERSFEQGRICFFSAGTGNPFFTTDTAAVLRAVELNAGLVLKGTNVDGVYTADPKKNENAELLKDVTYDAVLQKKLNVMDMTAFSLARDYHIHIKVFNLGVKGSLVKAITDKNLGTLIHE